MTLASRKLAIALTAAAITAMAGGTHGQRGW
jgi:hypothetical protein